MTEVHFNVPDDTIRDLTAVGVAMNLDDDRTLALVAYVGRELLSHELDRGGTIVLESPSTPFAPARRTRLSFVSPWNGLLERDAAWVRWANRARWAAIFAVWAWIVYANPKGTAGVVSLWAVIVLAVWPWLWPPIKGLRRVKLFERRKTDA